MSFVQIASSGHHTNFFFLLGAQLPNVILGAQAENCVHTVNRLAKHLFFLTHIGLVPADSSVFESPIP